MRNWLLWLVLLGVSLAGQERLALVIGNDAYEYWDRLKKSGEEVTMVAQGLRRCGFALYQDKAWINVANGRMKQLLEEFKMVVKGSNSKVVLFYYAGHGFEFGGDQYLVPVDMPKDVAGEMAKIRGVLPDTPAEQLKKLALKNKAVSLKEKVEKIFDTSGKRVNIFVVNACRDAFAGRGNKQEMPTLPDISGTFTIYATASGKQAGDNLLFAKEFCHNLRQKDMTLARMVWNLKTAVAKGSNALPTECQRVEYRDNLFGHLDKFIWGERSLQISLLEVPRRCQGQVRLRAQVDPEPTRVEFVINGKVIGCGHQSGRDWSCEWDSSRIANGSYLLVAQAYRNGSGGEESQYAVHSITVANPQPERPVVPPPAPSPAAVKVDKTGATGSSDPRRQLLSPFLVTIEEKLVLTAELFYDDYPWRGDKYQKFEKEWKLAGDKQIPLHWSDKLAYITAELSGKIEIAQNQLQVQGEIQLVYNGRSQKKSLQKTLVQTGDRIEQEVKLDDHWCKLALQLLRKSTILDMTSDKWQTLAVAEQITLAGIYQQWYADSFGLPVEKAVAVGGTKIVLRLIPPGGFWMGSPEIEGRSDEKRHRVVISQAFYLGKYEVTQGQWQAVMGKNPAWFTRVGINAPVEQVSWDKCQEFCGRTGLRLPSETEWEYACRAGTTSKYYWGDGMDSRYAWYDEGLFGKTHPVGETIPNGFRLYDVSGNVREWCQDWYDSDYYSKGESYNPTGPSTGSNRVYRGGSFSDDASDCRSANRVNVSPDFCVYYLGLRVAAQCR